MRTLKKLTLPAVLSLCGISAPWAAAHAAEGVNNFGAYGELHYANVPAPGVNGDELIDFHRFVLFFGHEFSDTIQFYSEVELEHAYAGEDEPGEVELEQAYLQFQLNDLFSASTGVFLVPVGIINETHEPNTFYGVERNPVESRIIPSTWREAGVMLTGTLPDVGLRYDLAYHSGLDEGANIRSGRQNAAKAEAENKAATARVKYTAIPGLELAASAQYQSNLDQIKGGVNEAILLESHVIWRVGSWDLRALYAMWDISGDPGMPYLDQQQGYYLEGSYKITPQWGVFLRHNDLQYKRDGAGFELDEQQQNVGVNYWPHEDVVLKADIQWQNKDAGDANGFNLGLGYQF